MNSAFHLVISRPLSAGLAIILNRPEAINALSEAMLDAVEALLDRAQADPSCRFVLFTGAGAKGFCAGGDVKHLARLGASGHYASVDAFFRKEYGLDLRLHLFPKPIIVLADGITMGGGLGIAAGADIRLATPRTRMAMPETRIGFFPDIGSTGWMFARSPKGYPEYLGLTGYDMAGIECVRLGFATHFIREENIPRMLDTLETLKPRGEDKPAVLKEILGALYGFLEDHLPVRREMDGWVEKYFAGKSDLREILASLRQCHEQEDHCRDVFSSIAERSPTALVLTLALLRHNEGKPMTEVFATELKAARFITRHPDYIEGVRARLFDRDDRPQWKPDNIEDVDISGFVP